MSNGHISLEDFLAQERQRGDEQGEGEFTIDLASALDKLERYQFEDPIVHILFAVRAAIAVGARDIELSFPILDNVQVKFLLDEPGEFGDSKSLLESFSKIGSGDEVNHNLTMALKAGRTVSREGVCWAHLRGSWREDVICTKEEVRIHRSDSAHADPKVSELKFYEICSKKLRTPYSGNLLNPFSLALWKEMIELFSGANHPDKKIALLYKRLQVVPREICFAYSRPMKRLGTEKEHQVAELLPPNASRLGFWVVVNRSHQTFFDLDGEVAAELSEGFATCSRYARTKKGAAQVHWVLDGVVLESEELKSESNGYEAWVLADELRTDLSEFKIVRDENHREKIAELESWVQATGLVARD